VELVQNEPDVALRGNAGEDVKLQPSDESGVGGVDKEVYQKRLKHDLWRRRKR